MPAERLPMRKIREVLRLRWSCGVGERPTARACQMARSTVGEYVKRARRAGLSSWEAVKMLDDVELEDLPFPGAPLACLISSGHS